MSTRPTRCGVRRLRTSVLEHRRDGWIPRVDYAARRKRAACELSYSRGDKLEGAAFV
jgi:hypothetical protein